MQLSDASIFTYFRLTYRQHFRRYRSGSVCRINHVLHVIGAVVRFAAPFSFLILRQHHKLFGSAIFGSVIFQEPLLCFEFTTLLPPLPAAQPGSKVPLLRGIP